MTHFVHVRDGKLIPHSGDRSSSLAQALSQQKATNSRAHSAICVADLLLHGSIPGVEDVEGSGNDPGTAMHFQHILLGLCCGSLVGM